MSDISERLTEKEAAVEQAKEQWRELIRLKLRERFLQRERLKGGGGQLDAMLATVQKTIKVTQAYFDFLDQV